MGVENTATGAEADDALDTNLIADGEDTGADNQIEGASEEEDGELVLTLDDVADPELTEADQPGDNSVIRTLRQQLREEQKRRKELEQASAPKAVELGPKPTLADFGYDEEQFETALDAWKEEKRKADAAAEQQQAAQAEQGKVWQEAEQRYRTEAASLGLDDFEERQAAVDEALGPAAAVIAVAAKSPAKVVASLAKNPAALAELAKLKNNPIGLAAAIARAEARGEGTMKKRTPPNPDRPASGSAPMPGGADKKLAQLEKEAEKTGDRTALIAYRRELRAAGKL